MDRLGLFNSENPNFNRNVMMAVGATAALVGAVAFGSLFHCALHCGTFGTLGAALSGATVFGGVGAWAAGVAIELKREAERASLY